MKLLTLYPALLGLSLITACDVQSGMTKKGLEKYMPTPTPERKVEVVEQIDPADIVNVDVTQQGLPLSVNRNAGSKAVDCNKYNKVAINTDAQEITIKGACQQVMINGDKNKIVAAAFSEIVLNGHENDVQYSKYANGKKPIITDNGNENVIQKTAPSNSKVQKSK